jgi:anhydro-N-acetylmuramic acid kinase
MALVIGLNSGSSFDGLDAVLIEIEPAADGYPKCPKFIDGIAYEWPAHITNRVKKAFENQLSIFELTRLNYEMGAVYAEATRQLLEKTKVISKDIYVIGYDGQTIYQEPSDPTAKKPDEGDYVGLWTNGYWPVGLQLGEPAVVADLIDVPVVSQFRPVDHALGGTGAPLMQFLDFCAFREIGPVLTLNIGGIANCQLANADRSKMMAFDTGPGNIMIDYAMNEFYGRPYDKDGEIAASGNVDEDILASLLDQPFFKRKPPRSAWRLDFGSSFAAAAIEKYSDSKNEDLIATFTAFTAHSILQSIKDNIGEFGEISEIIASGGGVRNSTIMNHLEGLFQKYGVSLVLSDKYGIPAQYKEAVKFGTLAYANMNSMANNIPAASGASKFAVMGKHVHAPRDAKC